MQPVYRIMTRYQVIGDKNGAPPVFSKCRVQSAKCSFCGGPGPRNDKGRSVKHQDDKEKKHRGDKKEGPRVTDL